MAIGRKLLIGALLTAVALPALAQTPTPQARHGRARMRRRPPPQQAAPAPFTNPFAALLGRTGAGAPI